MKVKLSQAISMVAKFIKARLVPMIVGSPAIGKSAIVHDIAKTYGLLLIDMRASQCDPVDMNGFPSLKGERASYLPMDTFPLEGDPIPAGYNGWLLFMDEFNSGTKAVQAASYKLILDRKVGNRNLHKNVAIVCAGNLDTDNAITEELSTALQSRLVHIEIEPDVKCFLDWAYENGIDHRITSYLQFKPTSFYTFSPDHTDKTYASSRTWEFANRILKHTEEGDPDRLPMLAGAISEGVAREFMGFIKIESELPKIPAIIANPTGINMPEEPAIIYALTGSIGSHANSDNIAALMKYVNRMPKEFQVVTLREALRRNKPLVATEPIREWIATSAVELF